MKKDILFALLIVIIVINLCNWCCRAKYDNMGRMETLDVSDCGCDRIDVATRGTFDSTLPPCPRKYRGRTPFDYGPCYNPELNPYWTPLNTTLPYIGSVEDGVDIPIARSVSDAVPYE